jgi:hypothetical protein
MAVLVEAFNVIVKLSAIEAKYPDDLAAPCEWLEFSRDESGTMWTRFYGTDMGKKITHERWMPGKFFWIESSNVLTERVCESDKKWWQFWR